MTGPASKGRLDQLATNEFEFHGHTKCCGHIQSMSLQAYPIADHAQLLKGLIAKHNIGLIVLSANTPSQVILDLCHVTKVMIKTDGDPRAIETVLSIDLCGAAVTNLLVEKSLATIAYAKWYYAHIADVRLRDSYYISENPSGEIGLCGNIVQYGLYRNGEHESLKGMCCKRSTLEMCPSLFLTKVSSCPILYLRLRG